MMKTVLRIFGGALVILGLTWGSLVWHNTGSPLVLGAFLVFGLLLAFVGSLPVAWTDGDSPRSRHGR